MLVFVVLNAGEVTVNLFCGMVVEDCEGSDGMAISEAPFFGDEFAAHEVAEGFGTVSVTALADEAVKTFDEVRLDGDAKSD